MVMTNFVSSNDPKRRPCVASGARFILLICIGRARGEALVAPPRDFDAYRFRDYIAMASGAAVDRTDSSTGAVAADVNGDGSIDLFVANSFGEANELLIGDGAGGFTAVTSGAAVDRT
eukprot:SAG31_NODE_7289_length_1730_cov_3.258737_1_plen_117_part_01